MGANGDNDADDQLCFPGPTIAECLALAIGGDLDFDGHPYLPDWPNGSKAYPSPLLIGAFNGRGIGPMSFTSDNDDNDQGEGNSGYSGAYNALQFETDIPASESTCNVNNGVGCVAPPVGAKFYPFYNQLKRGSDCLLTFSNEIPGRTTDDFGKDVEYGSLPLDLRVTLPVVPCATRVLYKPQCRAHLGNREGRHDENNA